MRSLQIGQHLCRGCNGSNLFSALDLGETPLANELVLTKINPEVFPLHLRICKDCCLGQVANTVPPERLFLDYRYQSGPSRIFSEHLDRYVSEITNELTFDRNGWVLEIASNDGLLLNKFRSQGIKCIGVEPSSNISRIATSAGNYVINDFFSSRVAKMILDEFGSPTLIVANNVLAHVPDLNDFLSGISTLSSYDTLTTIENPSLLNILKDNQFDTIYHEHYSYLSELFMEHICTRHDLELLGIKTYPIHGGSNRYYLRKSGSEILISNLKSDKARELTFGLNRKESWVVALDRMQVTIREFRVFLQKIKARGENVVGYGAAAKTATLLNLSGITAHQIDFIVDKSEEKIGRLFPVSNIPIVEIDYLRINKFDHIIIFPWNLVEEILNDLRPFCNESTQIWRVIPELERVR